MNLNTKVPPPPRLPRGLSALVNGALLLPNESSTTARRGEAEDITRAWRPQRPPDDAAIGLAVAGGFRNAADERTVVGRADLRNPALLRSDRPPSLAVDLTPPAADDDVVDFVGLVSGADLPDPVPETGASWKQDEKTTLYRPLRPHLAEEATDEYTLEDEAPTTEAPPNTPKVIVSPTVLAGRPFDITTSDATKRRRKRERASDGGLGLALFILGVAALCMGISVRYARPSPLLQKWGSQVTSLLIPLRGHR